MPTPGRGTLVWGARTTSADPEWRYISVRRLSWTLFGFAPLYPAEFIVRTIRLQIA